MVKVIHQGNAYETYNLVILHSHEITSMRQAVNAKWVPGEDVDGAIGTLYISGGAFTSGQTLWKPA